LVLIEYGDDVRFPLRAIVLVCGLALAGCAAGPGSTSPSGSGSPAGSATPAVSGTPGTSPSGVLVSFRRQGGLMGVDDQLTVQADGSYRVGPSKTGKLSDAELAELRRVLDQAQIPRLPAVNRTEGVADGNTYTVSYGGHTVVAEDGAVPASLEPVIAALSRILGRG
jgi:hypothetical protein